MKLIKQIEDPSLISVEVVQNDQVKTDRYDSNRKFRRSFKYSKGYWDANTLTGILNIYDHEFGFLSLVVQDSVVKDYIDPTDKGQYDYWVETLKTQGYQLVYGLKIQSGMWQGDTALIDGVKVSIKQVSSFDFELVFDCNGEWMNIDHPYIEIPKNLSLTGA